MSAAVGWGGRITWVGNRTVQWGRGGGWWYGRKGRVEGAGMVIDRGDMGNWGVGGLRGDDRMRRGGGLVCRKGGTVLRGLEVYGGAGRC